MKAYPDRKMNNICQHFADVVDFYIEKFPLDGDGMILWRNCLIGDLTEYVMQREIAKRNFKK